MAFTDAFKLSIDVQLGASCAYEDTNFKVLSTPHGETTAENIYHCPNVCESCGQFIRTNVLRTSNLLDSYSKESF